ncbi:hypothetical protein RRG08_066010 [Elysia crispata]|uniref:Uncharacterized protein n=1 Tax=Elysia crispata TaxID=231223 RepID=A0AAE1CM57_9GAST|nr:hypothetical protein RRG08_066010 [Elysia crispata]
MAKWADIKVSSHKIYYQLTFSVNFVTQCFPAVKSTPTRGYAQEKGGSCRRGTLMAPGVFSFFSYCDPRSVETLDVFQICMQWAMTGKLSVKDVEEAKLEVFLKVQLFTNRYSGRSTVQSKCGGSEACGRPCYILHNTDGQR